MPPARRQNRSEVEVPSPARERAETSYVSGYDQSHIIQSMLETQRCIGGLEAKIDQVINSQSTASVKIDRVETAITYVKAGAIVLAFVIPLLGGFIWWSFGEKLNALRDGTIVTTPPAPPPQTAPPAPVPTAPNRR